MSRESRARERYRMELALERMVEATGLPGVGFTAEAHEEPRRPGRWREEGEYWPPEPCLECGAVVAELESFQVPDGSICFACLDRLELDGGLAAWKAALPSQVAGRHFFAESCSTDPLSEQAAWITERAHMLGDI